MVQKISSSSRLAQSALHQPQTPETGLGAIIGKWPGDETDEEIAEALQGLDPELPHSGGDEDGRPT